MLLLIPSIKLQWYTSVVRSTDAVSGSLMGIDTEIVKEYREPFCCQSPNKSPDVSEKISFCTYGCVGDYSNSVAGEVGFDMRIAVHRDGQYMLCPFGTSAPNIYPSHMGQLGVHLN